MKDPNVLIVILNWNGWKDTIECMRSLFKINYENIDLIMVDNGSLNNSFSEIKNYIDNELALTLSANEASQYKNICKTVGHCDHKIDDIISYESPNSKNKTILIKNETNYGFAQGNNIAINFALKAGLNPDYFLLLNNDTVVSRGFLAELVIIAESDENIGFVGPKIYQCNKISNKNIISFAGGIVNLWTGKSYRIGSEEVDSGQFDLIQDVDYIEGSCLLIRKNLLCKIGLLDSSYFAYWEDTDLCMKGAKAGYRAVYAPNAVIWHKVSASSNYKVKVYFLNRNRIWFERRHANTFQYMTFILYLFLFDIWFLIFISIFYHQNLRRVHCLGRAVLDGFKEANNSAL